MELKALATDVDGTITSKGAGISVEAIQAIRHLEDMGVPVILASARPFPILNILREYIGCTGAVVCENGGHVEHKGEARILGDRGDGLRFLAALKEAHGGLAEEAWTNAYNIVDVALERTIPPVDIRKILEGYPSPQAAGQRLLLSRPPSYGRQGEGPTGRSGDDGYRDPAGSRDRRQPGRPGAP